LNFLKCNTRSTFCNSVAGIPLFMNALKKRTRNCCQKNVTIFSQRIGDVQQIVQIHICILIMWTPLKKFIRKERQPPQKAANVSVVLIKSRKTISTSLKCIKYDCNVLVNFQKIILELTTVVDGCKGQVWGLKPAQGPLSSGYRKFNPRTALTRN